MRTDRDPIHRQINCASSAVSTLSGTSNRPSSMSGAGRSGGLDPALQVLTKRP
jgi:hypothetical protein